MNKEKMEFLGGRMKQLREKNGIKSLEAMKDMLTAYGNESYQVYNKSTLSRVEKGSVQAKTMIKWARAYCTVLGYSEEQTELFLRGEKIAVPDTSALLKNPQLIDELGEEYNLVVIPDIVIGELEGIKNSKSGTLAKNAWEIIRSIGNSDRVKKMNYKGDRSICKDEKIISIARSAGKVNECEVHIITDDADYSALLKGDNRVIALTLKEYMITKQKLVNMKGLIELDAYFADDYSNIAAPDKDEINAYLSDGNTLLISTLRNRKASFNQKKEKIKWLISHGADVNKRDCKHRYFPPLTHAIQMNDYQMFIFLLNECHADPNIGSRNPHYAGKLRQKNINREKNEGNMPLMVAAWDNKVEFVKALCADKRTSINQQDANGYTALIKACYWGFIKCRDILIKSGADTKIVDIDGLTAEDHYNVYLETGREKPRNKKKGRRNK
ncbi:MAG: ankyrin repeat domain-containing protein [Acutalibacteraceae bacterium]|nr:ankyrin repeat domain-containing protein [Clostridia bacterium]MEE3451464.1 ankyrin repeat domain-containing protein [Acutalibacteraceae bacterium]